MNEQPKDISSGTLKKEKIFLIIFSVLFLLFIFFLAPSSLKSEGRGFSRDTARFVAIGQIQNALEMEYSFSTGYPLAIPEYAPQSDSQGKMFYYELKSRGFAYKLGVCMEGREFWKPASNCPEKIFLICQSGYYCVSSEN